MLERPTLTQLAEKYAVDKLHAHSYLPFYEHKFTPIRHEVETLLEVGIGFEELMKPFVPRYVHGASLRMWHEFFIYADIYACDIRPDTLINEKRIYSRVCDQSNAKDLQLLAEWIDKPIDIIVDDGSHEHEHQVLTAVTLLPWLAKGGTYIIEDVRDPIKMERDLVMSIPMTFHAKVLCFNKRPDDNLVVVEGV